MKSEQAHLEWWANSATCLARIPVRIEPPAETATGTAVGAGSWNAALSPPLDRDVRRDLRQLIDADPVATLRSVDGAATLVTVEQPEDAHRLRLSCLPET
ncbi:hypothetical protein [Streptomyces sp. NPDC059788]|uniref:hypothetical protein n=1 Tax=Streptomyces sp. NPDC059788 TaxID=3346948 RepID=UPI0036632C67